MRTGRPSLPGPGTVLLSAGCALVIAAVLVLGSGRGAPAPEVGSSASQPLALAAGAFAPLPGAPVGTPARHDRSALGRAYGRLPLAFEANRGQFDRRAAFVARGAGYSLFLTKRSAVLSLAAGGSRGHKASRHAALTIGLVGASPRARLTGERGLPGKVNYLIGRNRSRWHTSVPTFGRVAYGGVWRGIGASFYGHGGQLEYDFNVAAGADPGRIGLSFAGAQSVAQAPGGALLVRLAGGIVRQLEPHAYQTVAGVRRTIASRYVLERGRVGVRLGAYDHQRPLVIDPVLAYSTYLGGSGTDGFDSGNGIAVDSNGSAYIVGETGSTNFPTTTNAFQRTAGSRFGGAFVTKLSPDGTALVYSTYLGGNNANSGRGIAVDSSGSAYVTGATASTDFPTTTNAFQRKNAGEFDAFVTKLSPDGAALVYSTYLGGGTDANGRTPSDHPREAIPRDEGEAIAIDSNGSAYVTGVTGSIDFPTTKNAVQGKFGGGSGVVARDAFVTKLSADGGALVYSTYLGGSGNENGFGIAVDSSGSAYVTGSTSSTDFRTQSPEQPANAGGSLDAFVTKLGPDGTTLVYSTYLGGSGTDGGRGIAVDSSGSAYVTGSTSSTDFSTQNPEQSKNAGDFDAFVTKLSANGTALAYSTYLGGGNADFGRGIAVDSSGSAYVTGQTNSTDFPTQNPEQSKNAGDFDAFVTKLSANGTALAYSTYLGGSGTDGGNGIAVDSSGSAYVTGQTNSTDFPTQNPEQGKNAGGQNQAFDAFVTKLSEVPVVATGAASSVSTGSATLNGTVNPSGKAASYHFEYGTSTSYGQSTPTQSAGADSQTHPESAAIAGLAPGTTYHFRIVATNSAGTSLGADQIFTTQASPAAPKAPQVSTGPAESVSASAAKLTGTVNPNGQATSYRFDYGTSTSYGASTPSQSAGAGSSKRSVAATIHGLKPGRTYHYRLLARSPAGTSSGGDRTFKTRPVKPRAACVVPNLHHNTLAQAKKLLARHHCALGRVTRPKQNNSGRLVVVKQSPRSGSRRPGGTPVALTLAHLTRRMPVVPRFTG